MRKTLSAFTIVELVLVISIIGILSTIGVVSYSSINTNSIDSKRELQAKAIAEALEGYYEKNGEYPGCVAMTQSVDLVTANVLKGLQKDILTTPGDSSGANSIICDELTDTSLDKFSYVGDTNVDCTTGSACLYFTLSYIKEGSSEVGSINSRRTAEYVAIDVADNFNRTAGSLGTTSTGGIPWEANSGSWSTNGTKAVTSTAADSNPTATVNYNFFDIDASVDISSSGSGDALIIRSKGGSGGDHIRARYYHYYTSSTTAGGCSIGSWSLYQTNVYTEGWPPGSVIPSSKVGGYCIPYDDFPGINGSGVARYKTIVSSTTTPCDPGYTTCYLGTKYSRPVSEILPVTTYTYYYYIKLEEISGGVVTKTLYNSNYGSAISKIRLVAEGSSIKLYLNGSTSPRTTVTSTFNQTEKRHGIGRATTGSNYTASALDNFTLARP